MHTRQLDRDEIVPATMFDPEVTYFADGTPVTMTWVGGSRTAVAVGRTAGFPYDFQAVQFDDGERANIAPHVLTRR